MTIHVALFGEVTGRIVEVREKLERQGFVVEVCTDRNLPVHLDIGARKQVLVVVGPFTGAAIELAKNIEDARRRTSSNGVTLAISPTRAANDELRGLGIRADEYLIEPIAELDLAVTLRQLAAACVTEIVNDELVFGDLRLSRAIDRATLRGVPLSLDPAQIRILTCLMMQPDRAWTRGEIKRFVWGTGSSVDDKTVDVYIGRIRAVLKYKASVDPIRTIVNFGYGLNKEFTILSSTPKKVRRLKK